MVLRTLGYVLGAESALLLLPLLVAALYREDPVPFLIPLLALGVCGVYFERMYDELKGRPLYIVRQVLRTEQPKELDR